MPCAAAPSRPCPLPPVRLPHQQPLSHLRCQPHASCICRAAASVPMTSSSCTPPTAHAPPPTASVPSSPPPTKRRCTTDHDPHPPFTAAAAPQTTRQRRRSRRPATTAEKAPPRARQPRHLHPQRCRVSPAEVAGRHCGGRAGQWVLGQPPMGPVFGLRGRAGLGARWGGWDD